MPEQLGACQLAAMCHSRELIGDQQLSGMRLSSALLASSGIRLGARTPEPVRLSQRTSCDQSVAAGIHLRKRCAVVGRAGLLSRQAANHPS